MLKSPSLGCSKRPNKLKILKHVARFRDMWVCDGADEMAAFKYVKTQESKIRNWNENPKLYEKKLLCIAVLLHDMLKFNKIIF